MKKIILSAIVMCFGIAVQAQTDRVVGVHFGMPMGDAADVSTFNLGVDAASLFYITDDFYAGFAIGATYFIGKEQDEFNSANTDGFGYLIGAASGQYSFGGIFVAADLGYAFHVGTTDTGESGFYYQPKAGYHITDEIDAYVGYKGISGGDTSIAALCVGAAYRF
jgi:hypothetical protein